MNISQVFFSEIDKIARHDIPDEVMSRARHSLLDYLAVTCAGAEFQKEKIYISASRKASGELIIKAVNAGDEDFTLELDYENGDIVKGAARLQILKNKVN